MHVEGGTRRVVFRLVSRGGTASSSDDDVRARLDFCPCCGSSACVAVTDGPSGTDGRLRRESACAPTRIAELLESFCKPLRAAVADPRLPVTFDPVFRELMVRDPGRTIADAIWYCPYCGESAPTSLRDTWFGELDAAGIVLDIMETDSERVPLRYRSEAWWVGRHPWDHGER